MRVLIVKTSSMGDIIHTLPAVTDAAEAIPGIQFDWVAEEGFAEIPKWHPAVNDVIPVAIRRWRKSLFKSIKSPEWSSFKNEMKHHQYDCVIDAQGLLKSAFVTRFVNAPVCGFDRASVREKLACFSYDRCFRVSKDQHAVERVRELFARSLNYQKPKTLGNFGLNREQFGREDEHEPFVVFLHGTTRADKLWPLQHWQTLCEQLTQQGWHIRLPWHSEEERERAEAIASVSDKATVIPKTNIQGVAATLAESRAFVAVDTGLGHLGAALAVPGISLYGPTSPKLIGAYGAGQTYLQAETQLQTNGDENNDAMQQISAASVFEGLQAVLNPAGALSC